MGIAPRGDAERVAGRAAISVLVPLLALWSLGRLEWSLYASFGAFTSLYGRERAGVRRTRLQVVVGIVLTACVTLGSVVGLSDERRWLAVPVAALVAGTATWESARRGWHPPGALFPVFAFAAVASVPSGAAEVGTAALCSASAAALSILVGAAGLSIRRDRPTAPRHGPAAADRPRRTGIAHPSLTAASVLAAGLIATGAGIGRPYWAMVAAVVPFAAREWHAQLSRGLSRVVGTAAGLGAAAVLLALDLRGLGIIVAVTVLQALAELVVGRSYALALVAVTPLALLMVNLAAPLPTGTLLAERAVETLVGTAVGLIVARCGTAVTAPAAPR
ncbi:MAG: FUSC family protein [Nocardioides sp.]|uniref:FUSC family protein n=1 Tax=Nocardioides sp. TaxID=35761 RepID=UPI0039E25C3E